MQGWCWCDIRGLCAECHSFHNSSQDWVHCLASTTPAPMLSPFSIQHSALINSTLLYITITLEHIITLTLLPFKAEVSASSSHSPCINKENQAAGCDSRLSVTVQLLPKIYLQIIQHYNLCKNLQFIQSQNCN